MLGLSTWNLRSSFSDSQSEVFIWTGCHPLWERCLAALGKEWGLPLGVGLGATHSLILQPGSHPRKAPLKHICDAYHGPSLTPGAGETEKGEAGVGEGRLCQRPESNATER